MLPLVEVAQPDLDLTGRTAQAALLEALDRYGVDAGEDVDVLVEQRLALGVTRGVDQLCVTGHPFEKESFWIGAAAVDVGHRYAVILEHLQHRVLVGEVGDAVVERTARAAPVERHDAAVDLDVEEPRGAPTGLALGADDPAADHALDPSDGAWVEGHVPGASISAA